MGTPLRGQADQALGRSRGGFSTKIHLKTDLDGDFLAFDPTGGEPGDAPHCPILPDPGPDIAPRAAVGDRGGACPLAAWKADRATARRRGIAPLILRKSNAKSRPAIFAKVPYKARARTDQAVGKLKRLERVALRCDKTALSFLSFAHLATAFLLIKSIHRT